MSFLTDETLFAGTLNDSDVIHLVDVSDTTQNAAGSSYKLTIAQLKTGVEKNIYTDDGTLTGARVVNQADHNLSFQGGNVGFGIAPDSDARTHIQGVDATSGNYALKVKNSASKNIISFRNDGLIHIGNLGSYLTASNTNSPSDLVIYGNDKTIFDSRFTTAVLGAKYGKQLTIHCYTGVGTSFIRLQGVSYGGGGTLITEDADTGEVGLRSSFFSGGFEHRFVNGSVIIGADSTPNASSILELTSTTKGFLPPRMTTAQKTAIGVNGLVVFDTDLDKLCVYTGSAWETVTSL